MAFKKCPRCSLNYIKNTDVLCRICLEEVGNALKSNDEEEEYDFCPECGEHIIKVGEEMCYQCMIESNKEEADLRESKEDDWDKAQDDDAADELYDQDDDDDDLTDIDLDDELDEEE